MRQDALAFLRPDLVGTGQTIAVLDTGIDYQHESLGAGIGPDKKVIAGWDFVDDDNDPMDTHGHGTQVAGVIAADQFTQGGFTYRGIAPGAKLVALRIAPDTSSASPSRIEEALDWVLANATDYSITTVNLSFGFGRYAGSFVDPTFGDELQQMANRGIAFVSSAGNDGTDDGFGIDYPAADLNAFGVGSVNGSDVISEFSQRSSNLDLLAVGEGVRTTTLNDGYANVSGTSFAAPAVAATIALMRQVDPSYTLADIRSMFRASLPGNYDGDDEIGDTTDVNYRRLDILSAVSVAVQRQSGTPPQQWSVGVGGSDSDMAFDRFGALHFVYYDEGSQRMEYAVRNVSGKWSVPSLIDDRAGVGKELSMKLDSLGRPNVAYLDGPAGRLRFGTFDGERWSLSNVDSSRITGLQPSLAIGADDRAYVAYFRKTSADLKLATRDVHGNWSLETLESDGFTGLTPVAAMDNQQRLAIAYIDGGRDLLKIKRRNANNTWTTKTIQKTVGDAAYVSLAFDSNNRARMSFYETKTADLWYATANDEMNWTAQRLVSRGAVGLYTNLRLDDDGRPSILYWDRRSNSLARQTYNGTKWSGTIIAAGAGKYATATMSGITGKWTYAAAQDASGGKLVLGEI